MKELIRVWENEITCAAQALKGMVETQFVFQYLSNLLKAKLNICVLYFPY